MWISSTRDVVARPASELFPKHQFRSRMSHDTVSQNSCDLGAARAASASGSEARSGTMLAASSGGCCLAFVDGAVINVALAVIGRDFELEPNALQRIINTELLPLAGSPRAKATELELAALDILGSYDLARVFRLLERLRRQPGVVGFSS
jgi:hypothetical protein